MALFGEKYGDEVRLVATELAGEVSRELCGGTHVANSAEVGIFAITSEGSSAANVRRIEAVTGPAAIDYFRERSSALEQAGELLGSRDDPLGAARRAAERLGELEKQAAAEGARAAAGRADDLAAAAEEVAGVRVVVGSLGEITDQRAMLEIADQVKGKLGDAAVVLGGAADGKVALVASFADGVVERGAEAVAVIKVAAPIVGGGGGGRANVAQAGGRDASKLDEALAAASEAIKSALS